MAKKATLRARLAIEDDRIHAEYQNGARACLNLLDNLRTKGISWHASELSTLLDSLSPEATDSFLFNLEIFLAEAVCYKNVQDCYRDAKLAHQHARKVYIDGLTTQKVA